MRRERPVEDLLEELRLQGWKVERTARGHYRAAPPDPTKPLVHFSHYSRSEDPTAWRIILSQLRRSGFRDRETPPPPPMPEDPPPLGEDPTKPATYTQPEPVIMPPKPPEKPSSDALFPALREARLYYGLTQRELEERLAAVAKAQGEHRAAAEEHARAGRELRKAKEAFDAAFSAEEP